jgi:hypothetical protein
MKNVKCCSAPATANIYRTCRKQKKTFLENQACNIQISKWPLLATMCTITVKCLIFGLDGEIQVVAVSVRRG